MNTPKDKTPSELRQELLDVLTKKGLPQTIEAFKKSVNDRSKIYAKAYRKVIELEVQYNELQREFLSGHLTKEAESVESNRLTRSLIDLIEQLDKDPVLLAGKKSASSKKWYWLGGFLLVLVGAAIGYWFLQPDGPEPTAGKVLYSIPPKMQVGTETECIIRISPEVLTNRELSAGIPDTAAKTIEAIPIGKVMIAELVGEEDAFRIKPKGNREQFIEKKRHTEWKFDVVPLKAGKQELTLKITVKQMLDEFGEVVKDVLVLDRDVEIISEPVNERFAMVDAGYVPLTTFPVAIDSLGNLEPEPDPDPDQGDDDKQREENNNDNTGETVDKGDKNTNPKDEVDRVEKNPPPKPNVPVAVFDSLKIICKTNKDGLDSLVFTSSETMRLYYKVNHPCYLRVIYKLADGRLYLFEDDREITRKEVGKFVELGDGYEAAEPFGAETIYFFAQNKKFPALITEQSEDGYPIIKDNLPTSLRKTRGMKKKGYFSEFRIDLTTRE